MEVTCSAEQRGRGQSGTSVARQIPARGRGVPEKRGAVQNGAGKCSKKQRLKTNCLKFDEKTVCKPRGSTDSRQGEWQRPVSGHP